MLDLWFLHRRAVLIAAALGSGLLVLLLITGVAVHAASSPGHRAEQGDYAAPPLAAGTDRTGTTSTSRPSGAASDVARWNAMPAIRAALTPALPAIDAADRSDPAAFAQAFATRLFTRTYATETRTQLVQWAQAQIAPLRSDNYPPPDWTKVLVDSLTDLSWDGAAQTPVPSSDVWHVLAGEDARDTVSAVSVRTDPQWESRVAAGYDPPDRLTTVQDVTLRITRQAGPATHEQTSSVDVSIAIQTGSSALGGYGAAATNNYVCQAVS